jgi:hypothetical protein
MFSLELKRRSSDTAGDSPYDTHEEQQGDGAYEGDEYRGGHASERHVQVKGTEDEAAQEGADDSEHDVSDDAVPAAHDERGQPTRDQADRHPDENCFYAHGVLLTAD